MEGNQTPYSLPAAEKSSVEPISLSVNGKARHFATFLICVALLVAVFAVTALTAGRNSDGWSQKLHGLFYGASTELRDGDFGNSDVPQTDPEKIPVGAVIVINKDLSYTELGETYLHNETPYAPNFSALLEKELSVFAAGDAPQVLILHTHTSESYLEGDRNYLEGAPGDVTYSREEDRNVISVGRALTETLKENGITAIHCTVMHDVPTLGGSYERSAETVKKYLKEYPTITLVIDLHRDAILTSDGEYVRTVGSDASMAQVMAVVGSDCNGTRHDRWEENLALALQLRTRLNQKAPNSCRPVSLRSASYNQELAPYYLLLEIGSGANSVAEARASAILVGQILAEMLQAR